jgi:hypothetical protein
MRMAALLSLAAIIKSTAAFGVPNEVKECASQAEKQFHRLGWKESNGVNNPNVVTYQNHYNKAIGKCLPLIENYLPGSQFLTLLDAYEGHIYASYSWFSRENKKYWEVPPTTCEVSVSELSRSKDGENKKACASRDEFEAQIGPFMKE